MDHIQPDLSICLIDRLPPETVYSLLGSLAATDPLSIQVIAVVERGASHVAELNRRFPEALIYEDDPVSLPVAANRAVRLAAGRYLALVGAGVSFSATTLLPLVTFLDDHPEVGLAGPALETPEGAILPTTGFLPGPFSLVGEMLRAGNRPWFTHTPGFSRRMEWVNGHCLLIRRECLEEIGPFREDLPLLWDLEYGRRGGRAGWHIFFHRDIRLPCQHVPSSGVSARQVLAELGRLFGSIRKDRLFPFRFFS